MRFTVEILLGNTKLTFNKFSRDDPKQIAHEKVMISILIDKMTQYFLIPCIFLLIIRVALKHYKLIQFH